MRKLTLDIDRLRVETFDVDGAEKAEGTVLGRQQWTRTCTLNDFDPCNQATNWPLDANCADSIAYYPGQEGNCTNVCASGPLVCDTSVEVCG